MPARSPELQALFDRLDRVDVRTPSPAALGHPRRVGRTLVRVVVTIVVVIVLPFFVLVRGATLFYNAQLPTWLALAAAATLTLGLLTAYGAWVAKRTTGRRRVRFVARWVALPLVLAYCGSALLYVAEANTKAQEVRAYYRALHPMLRLAVSTLIIAADDLVITDVARTPDDYVAMGLPVYQASLHFRQADGYVHALDLRTLGRREWKNDLMQVYFWTMGFRTLRHVGTADHLHVSLPARAGG